MESEGKRAMIACLHLMYPYITKLHGKRETEEGILSILLQIMKTDRNVFSFYADLTHIRTVFYSFIVFESCNNILLFCFVLFSLFTLF